MNENNVGARPLAAVTGASTGIGLELAKQFAEHGYDLLVAAENAELASAAAELRQLGAEVESVQVDLATPQGVEEFYRRIQSCGRPLDSAVINAGVGVWGNFAETQLEDELNLIQLNVTSAVHLAKRVVQDMERRGGGRILFTSSVAGTMPAPLTAVYGASKAFLLSLSQALHRELGERGITVTALMPGPTETEFFHRAGMDDTRVGREEKDDPADVARQGFEALMAGKDKVVAGSLSNKVQTTLGRVIPDQAKAKMHQNLVKPAPSK